MGVEINCIFLQQNGYTITAIQAAVSLSYTLIMPCVFLLVIRGYFDLIEHTWFPLSS